MTKSACMICGKEPPFDFQITRERDKEQDPDRKELEIHIKRNHSLEEIQKHANPSEFGRRKKAKADEQEQEQEGEAALKTDDVVAELFKEEGTKTTKSTSSRSRSRGGSSRSRRSTRAAPAVVEETKDTSSADL